MFLACRSSSFRSRIRPRWLFCLATTNTSSVTTRNTPTSSALVNNHNRTIMTTTNTTTTTSATSQQDHYQTHSADSYEQAYFYEAGNYQEYLVNLVTQRLQLGGGVGAAAAAGDDSKTPRIILDIGGGTGNFAQALVQDHSQTTKAIVVDPFLDPTTSSTSSSSGQVSFVKAPAEDFSKEEKDTSTEDADAWMRDFDQILLKEVVHHLEDRVSIFRGMYRRLNSSSTTTNNNKGIPSLLIITRPQTEIDYPLWDAARQVWKENQPSEDDFCKELQQAGFVDIQHSLESYPCQIQFERWQSMVRNRFWSTFSKFSDEDLNQACIQMKHEYQDRIDDQGVIHFEDRLVFITARKN